MFRRHKVRHPVKNKRIAKWQSFYFVSKIYDLKRIIGLGEIFLRAFSPYIFIESPHCEA